jgi:hypothetical protein
MQVNIPVAFVSRRDGGNLLLEAAQARQLVTLEFDATRNFDSILAK